MGLSVPLANLCKEAKLSGAVDMTEGKDTIQRDVDRLEEWSRVNIRKFNE